MISEMETSNDSTNTMKCSNGNNVSSLTSKSITFNRIKDCRTNDINWTNASDITLIVNNQKLSAHKNVLAINSDYFDRMFTSSFKERDQDNIEINISDVSYETLKTLIEFFYTSKLVITELNVQELLIGANILLLEDVRDVCVNYLKTMIDVDNCIIMKDFANSLGLNDLYSLCLTYIINNFRLIASSKEFMTVTYDEIMILIKNDNLFAKEEMVYDVVMHWIKHDPAKRSKYSPELLWFVRLPLVLNTYQGIIKVHEFQGARINGISSFRMEHRKPFRKGILMLSHYPSKSSPEWYDAALDQWHNCICENCQCKNFQTVLTPPRHLCTCILLEDGRLFAAGGYDYGRGMRLANIFDPKTNEWVCLDDMNCEHIKPHIVQLGLKVFVIGGLNNDREQFNVNLIQYYDLKKKKWFSVRTKINIMSENKTDTFVACVNEFIYFIGPTGSECYNPELNSWHSFPKLPVKNDGSAICTLNNNIYVIGGHSNDNYFKSVWTYYTETKQWAPVADLNTPRSQSGAVVMNGYIFVFGGKTNDKSYSNTFEVYNPHDNEWTISNATMNIDRCLIDAIVIEKSCTLFKKVFEDATNNIIH